MEEVDQLLAAAKFVGKGASPAQMREFTARPTETLRRLMKNTKGHNTWREELVLQDALLESIRTALMMGLMSVTAH